MPRGYLSSKRPVAGRERGEVRREEKEEGEERGETEMRGKKKGMITACERGETSWERKKYEEKHTRGQEQ